jgi:hypothetical protein
MGAFMLPFFFWESPCHCIGFVSVPGVLVVSLDLLLSSPTFSANSAVPLKLKFVAIKGLTRVSAAASILRKMAMQ